MIILRVREFNSLNPCGGIDIDRSGLLIIGTEVSDFRNALFFKESLELAVCLRYRVEIPFGNQDTAPQRCE